MILDGLVELIRLGSAFRNGLVEFLWSVCQLIDIRFDELDHLYGSLPLLEECFRVTYHLILQVFEALDCCIASLKLVAEQLEIRCDIDRFLDALTEFHGS